MLVERSRPDRVKKTSIQASQARYLNPGDPDAPRKMVKAIDRGFDGYVHGAYPHSMELFDPNQASGAFRMQGLDGTPYQATIRTHLALYVSPALSVFGMVALHIEEPALKEKLVGARKRFEESSEAHG